VEIRRFYLARTGAPTGRRVAWHDQQARATSARACVGV